MEYTKNQALKNLNGTKMVANSRAEKEEILKILYAIGFEDDQTYNYEDGRKKIVAIKDYPYIVLRNNKINHYFLMSTFENCHEEIIDTNDVLSIEVISPLKYNIGEMVIESRLNVRCKIVTYCYDDECYLVKAYNNTTFFRTEDELTPYIPKFKMGESVILKSSNEPFIVTYVGDFVYTCAKSTDLDKTHLFTEEQLEPLIIQVPIESISKSNEYNNIKFKPFDKVLWRKNKSNGSWKCGFFQQFIFSGYYKRYELVGGEVCEECIPYEGNEVFLGTSRNIDNNEN